MENRWGLKKHIGRSFSDILYIEWRYFNVFSEDISLVLSYSIGDPRNMSGRGACMTYISAFDGTSATTETIHTPLKSCRVDESSCAFFSENVRLEPAKGGYHLLGKTKDMEWDLNFYGIETNIEHLYRFKSLYPVREWMDWTIFMPRARVTGKIRVKGKETHINGYGYSDGNRGKWIPFSRMWEGFFYSSEESTVSLVKFNRQKGASMHIFTDDTHLDIPYTSFRIEHMKRDQNNNSTATITAKYKGADVKIDIETLYKSNLTIDMPFIFPDISIEEHFVSTSLRISLPNGYQIKESGKTGLFERTTRSSRTKTHIWTSY
jgi:hypothetical protein